MVWTLIVFNILIMTVIIVNKQYHGILPLSYPLWLVFTHVLPVPVVRLSVARLGNHQLPAMWEDLLFILVHDTLYLYFESGSRN